MVIAKLVARSAIGAVYDVSHVGVYKADGVYRCLCATRRDVTGGAGAETPIHWSQLEHRRCVTRRGEKATLVYAHVRALRDRM